MNEHLWRVGILPKKRLLEVIFASSSSYIFALVWAGGPLVFWLLVFYIFSKI